ncbi:hypothetical protein [Nonomuraea aurantiaca]|uniref:hypothetical protein n=1 Tax=Nonomuraea aurantiaca TaxID=2878562 RepID=UPI001CD9BD59|nr:hypothetical protein [Nonomuraea aurantiaca]MCA2229424.1 hypothetical protein [Nonomuraea aurantiaca]
MLRVSMPKSALMALVLATALLSTATPSATAETEPVSPQATCNDVNHCYGQISWPHGNVGGAEVELGTYKLQPSNAVDDFGTSEMWVLFDPPTGRPNDLLWLEFGAIHGLWCNTNMSWFSAIQRSVVPDDFVLQCHGAAAESNTKHVLKADEPFDGTWNLYRDGSLVTGYGSAPKGTNHLNVGTEITANNVLTSMTGGNLRFKYQATGNWANGWASSGYPAPGDNSNGSPCYSIWVSKPNDMRARCNIAPSVATTIEAYPKAKIAPPEEEVKRISALLQAPGATATASAQIQSVDTTNKAALSALDIVAPDDERSVTVMQLEGEFQGEQLPIPPGASAPRGNSLTVVFDGTTGEMLTLHLSGEKKLELSKLGQVKTLG